ncbi:MAG: hypothetical protein IH851_06090, partial [Armatimonadetes bacterium]|nr:hypothetical protein [Armatimonadota bacterium]
MDWKANWIWDSNGTRREWNRWVAFRREFDLSGSPKRGTLLVTGDAEYVAWLNGEWVGKGPTRGFPRHWRYERYDVAGLLRPGRNCLAVLGHSMGVSTFRYILSDAGVLAQLETELGPLAWTDGSWACLPDVLGPAEEFRISCQQGWVEPPLGPLAEGDWRSTGFDDGGWAAASVVEDARELVRSEVMTRVVAEVGAVRGVRSALVRPPAATWALSLRRYLLPGYTGAAPMELCGLVGVAFHVKHDAELRFELPGAWFWVQPRCRLNGRDMEQVPSRHNPWQNGICFEGKVRQGLNFAVFDVSGKFHEWTLQVTVDDLPLAVDGAFLVAGPFDSLDEAAELWEAADAAPWLSHPKVARIDPETAATATLRNPFARTAHAREQTALPLSGAAPGEIRLAGGDEGLEHQVILDLGRMSVGYWAFDVESEGPAELTLNGFEALQEGKPDFCWEMANTLECRSPGGRHRFRSLQRRGARYVLLQGRDVTVRGFRVLEETYPIEPAGRFECSDERLNRIFEMCALTARLCSEDTYVDCPTYEQTYWVGDARNEALINYAIFGGWPLARRSWELAAESLDRSPMVESHVPSGWPMIIPAWSFLWSIGCWEHYRYTGDRRFLERIYPAMRRQLRSAEERLNEQGLFEMEAWNLCDWAPMDQPHEGVVTHNQGWLCLSAEATAKAAEALGLGVEAEWARSVASRVAEACNRFLWNDGRESYTDCLKLGSGDHSETFSVQTQCVLALAGVPHGEREERVRRLLLGEDSAEGFVQVGTPFFMFFLFELLEREGRFAEVLRLIRERWGMMLDGGATTCWELFPGFAPGGRWTRSHCHAWSAGPAYFLIRNLLGIVPTGTECSRFVFRPQPCGVTSCRGSVPTL